MTNDRPHPDRNRAIEGDNTPQPNYNRLSAAQRDTVDRAVYGTIITGTSGNLKFSGYDPTPTTGSIEQRIESLREANASLLLKGKWTEELSDAASRAPNAAEARRALNVIISFDGDQCGCSINDASVRFNPSNQPVKIKPGQGR